MGSPAGYVVLIDGYNLLYRVWPAPGRLAEARDRLLQWLEGVRWPIPVTDIRVVFDSRGEARAHAAHRGRVAVSFLPSADAGLQDMIRRAPAPHRLLLLSDDRAITDTAKDYGVQVRSCAWLAARGGVPSGNARTRQAARTPDSAPLSAADARRITEELAHRWLRQ